MGDPDLQAQLVDAFFRELPRMRNGLPLAASAGGKDFSDLLHRLQNTCQFMAADRLLFMLKSMGPPQEVKLPLQRKLAVQDILRELDHLESQIRSGISAA